VIAAANPIRGRYQPALTFAENVELTPTILSRFDVLCVVKDVVDLVEDERLAMFVVRSHQCSHPARREDPSQVDESEGSERDVLPQDVLRKFIILARQECRPKLQDVDRDKVRACARVYVCTCVCTCVCV
jgi:DNA replication licensing factor MCM2